MKTLIVKYLPSNQRSRTKTLLEAFYQQIRNIDTEIEELDLCIDVPDLFSPERLAAYYSRIDGGTYKTPLPILAKMDRMTAQLLSADIVVAVFPMHNFSLPATVKAWFDSVILYGQVFKGNPKGGYIGFMTGKKALVLMTASGTYSMEGGNGLFGSIWEHGMSLAKLEFEFMGYSDVRGVLAESMARGPEVIARKLKEAVEEIQVIAQEWYGVDNSSNAQLLAEVQISPQAREAR